MEPIITGLAILLLLVQISLPWNFAREQSYFPELVTLEQKKVPSDRDKKTLRAERKGIRRLERAVMDSIRQRRMEDDSINVGYGYTKRGKMTNSVAKVDVKDNQMSSYSDIGEYLSGRVPGLVVMKRGNSYSFQIRGAMSLSAGTEPLVMVDGVETTDISSLNPQDVRSVEVLKDAAAATIYGTRAANGVILITTKSR